MPQIYYTGRLDGARSERQVVEITFGEQELNSGTFALYLGRFTNMYNGLRRLAIKEPPPGLIWTLGTVLEHHAQVVGASDVAVRGLHLAQIEDVLRRRDRQNRPRVGTELTYVQLTREQVAARARHALPDALIMEKAIRHFHLPSAADAPRQLSQQPDPPDPTLRQLGTTCAFAIEAHSLSLDALGFDTRDSQRVRY